MDVDLIPHDATISAINKKANCFMVVNFQEDVIKIHH